MIQTKKSGTPHHATMWFVGSTSSSTKCSVVTYSVASLRGRTIEPAVEQPIDFETNWAQVVAASAKTSLAFLENEQDLYED